MNTALNPFNAELQGSSWSPSNESPVLSLSVETVPSAVYTKDLNHLQFVYL